MVLASASQVRGEILRGAGVTFLTDAADLDEGVIKDRCRKEARTVEDTAMELACKKHNASFYNYTAGPVYISGNNKGRHEWFIEFSRNPGLINSFCEELDRLMQAKNIYYRDLIEGKVLQNLKVSSVKQGGFIKYMKSQGKLGGQNKVPRLANDRKLADKLALLTGKA